MPQLVLQVSALPERGSLRGDAYNMPDFLLCKYLRHTKTAVKAYPAFTVRVWPDLDSHKKPCCKRLDSNTFRERSAGLSNTDAVCRHQDQADFCCRATDPAAALDRLEEILPFTIDEDVAIPVMLCTVPLLLYFAIRLLLWDYRVGLELALPFLSAAATTTHGLPLTILNLAVGECCPAHTHKVVAHWMAMDRPALLCPQTGACAEPCCLHATVFPILKLCLLCRTQERPEDLRDMKDADRWPAQPAKGQAKQQQQQQQRAYSWEKRPRSQQPNDLKLYSRTSLKEAGVAADAVLQAVRCMNLPSVACRQAI